MGIEQFLRVLARRWILSVAVLAIVFGATSAYTFTRTPQYTASADVFVTIAPGTTTTSPYQDSQYILGKVKSYVELVDKPLVLEPVVAASDVDLTVVELSRTVVATNADGTSIINVAVTRESPRQAAELANAIAAQLQPSIADVEAGGSTSVKVKATVVREAMTPTDPSSPRVALNILLGALAGILLAVAAAFLLEGIDTRIRSESDLVQYSRFPAVGSVPATRRVFAQSVMVTNSQLDATESFRSIRARLRFVDVDDPPSTFVVTSSIPGEGKTTVSVNLAVVLAQTGASVCLIDADFRRPGVARALGVTGSVGLADVLAGALDFDRAKLSWGDGLLTVLTAGTPPPDPADLLGSAHMARLIERLKSDFDYVICDTPPVVPVADATVLAPRFDGTILVARHGVVSRSLLGRSSDSLRASGARIVGTVFNATPRRKSQLRYQYSPVADGVSG